MRRATHVGSLFTLCIIMFGSNPVHASAQDIHDLAGTVQAQVDGHTVNFPTLKVDVNAHIQGDVANVEIVQTFANPLDKPLNAKYLFPMNKSAAVYAMTMEVGDEIVEAQIKRKEDAKKTFEKAKSEGKAAALLTQHRPNMFTQNLANLMPGLPIKITLKYTQSVPKVDGDFELVVPLVVGPRYEPIGNGEAPDIIDDGQSFGKQTSTSTSQFGTWELEQLPAYPETAGVDVPKSIEDDRVSIKVTLESDISIKRTYSDTHKIDIEKIGKDDLKSVITLNKDRVIDNADFVLRYALSGALTEAGFMAEKEAKGGFFSLMLEPPKAPKDMQVTPREMVFVLDTSGSMSGMPIDASKTFMHHAIKTLRPEDYFRIIRFSNNATEFTSAPVLATEQNKRNGLRYVASLDAGGGTEIPSAIEQAFAMPPAPNTMRIVVFLTDGYIGNEATVLNQIHEKIGDARIYAFGVGTGVNRYLLDEMGRAGRGFARYLDPTEDPDDVAIALARKLESPVLTDINIDWGDMQVEDITPNVIPDLFAGDTIRIQGRFKGQGTHIINVQGKVRGHEGTLPLQITLPDAANDNEQRSPISLMWARSRIADHMRDIDRPAEKRVSGLSEDELKEQVVDLGLDFSLMTKWTSFVSVSKKVYNKNPEANDNANIPLPMVKGVTQAAYPSFGGGGVPEPGTLGGMAVLGACAFAARRRKAKRQAAA